MRNPYKVEKLIFYVVGFIAIIVGVNRTVSSGWMKWLLRERLEVPNPTEYVFNFSKEEVKQAVIERMGKYQYRDMTIYGFGYDVFRKDESHFRGNVDYFVFREQYAFSFCYRKRNGGRLSCLEMRLYLDSLAPQQTRARMEVTKLEVFTGYGLAVGIHGIGIGPILKDMPATTVEEYQVLYKIGKQLGVADKMPRINYPIGLSKKELMDTYYNEGFILFKYTNRSSWDEFDE